MSHRDALSMAITTIPKLDFDQLLSLAKDNPDRYMDMRSALINSTIADPDVANGRLAELQWKIDQIVGTESLPDQAMLDIARLLSERVATLGALMRKLEKELNGNTHQASHPPTR